MSVSTHLLHPLVAQSLTQHGIQAAVMECDPNFADTAAFCERYSISPLETANAIVVASKTEPVKYACCLVLATQKLDVNKTVCKLLQVKRCSFAGAEETIATTQMQIGGVTPVGVENMPIYVDAAAMACSTLVIGGGNRSSKLRLEPAELLKLPNVQVVEGLGLPR